ncbi:MAG: hypothetical protein ABL888_10810 [Pirellulaceae bacterium]
MKVMNRVWMSCLAIVCAMATTNVVQGQDLPDAKTVISKHLAAIGSVDEMKAAKSMLTEATMSMPGGPNGDMSASVKMKQKDGKAVSIIEIDQLGQMRQGTDGKVFWSLNPFTGPQLMDKESLGANAEEMAFVFPAVKWLDQLDKIKVVGLEEVDGKKCYKLDFEGDKSTTSRYFDKDTMLISKTSTVVEQMGQTMDIDVFTSDYKKVGGFMIAHKQVTATPQGEMTMTMEKIEINADLDDADFELPKEIKDLVEKKK